MGIVKITTFESFYSSDRSFFTFLELMPAWISRHSLLLLYSRQASRYKLIADSVRCPSQSCRLGLLLKKSLFSIVASPVHLNSASYLVFYFSLFWAFLGSCFGAREGMSCKLSTVYEDTFDLPIEQGYSDESACVLL